MLRFLVPAMMILSVSACLTAKADSAGMDMKGMHASAGMPSSGQAKDLGRMGDMKMPMSDEAAHVKPAARAFTGNHAFLVKVVSLPDPIPLQKHFTMGLAVYDGNHTDQELADAAVQITAGMRHGSKSGFAHSMQSSPEVASKDGLMTISGLSFHMMGKWTLRVDVQHDGKKGTAYLDLPCCGT